MHKSASCLLAWGAVAPQLSSGTTRRWTAFAAIYYYHSSLPFLARADRVQLALSIEGLPFTAKADSVQGTLMPDV